MSEAQQKKAQEQSLEKMEALLAHSALGVHVLFENSCIATALKEVKDESDFYDFQKMKIVQDAMTELITKKTFEEKVLFLKSLDQESYKMVIRAYFHIVENTVRQNSDFQH